MASHTHTYTHIYNIRIFSEICFEFMLCSSVRLKSLTNNLKHNNSLKVKFGLFLFYFFYFFIIFFFFFFFVFFFCFWSLRFYSFRILMVPLILAYTPFNEMTSEHSAELRLLSLYRGFEQNCRNAIFNSHIISNLSNRSLILENSTRMVHCILM